MRVALRGGASAVWHVSDGAAIVRHPIRLRAAPTAARRPHGWKACQSDPSVPAQKTSAFPLAQLIAEGCPLKSEERRVGKEGRSRWATDQAEDGIRDA